MGKMFVVNSRRFVLADNTYKVKNILKESVLNGDISIYKQWL